MGYEQVYQDINEEQRKLQEQQQKAREQQQQIREMEEKLRRERYTATQEQQLAISRQLKQLPREQAKIGEAQTQIQQAQTELDKYRTQVRGYEKSGYKISKTDTGYKFSKKTKVRTTASVPSAPDVKYKVEFKLRSGSGQLIGRNLFIYVSPGKLQSVLSELQKRAVVTKVSAVGKDKAKYETFSYDIETEFQKQSDSIDMDLMFKHPTEYKQYQVLSTLTGSNISFTEYLGTSKKEGDMYSSFKKVIMQDYPSLYQKGEGYVRSEYERTMLFGEPSYDTSKITTGYEYGGYLGYQELYAKTKREYLLGQYKSQIASVSSEGVYMVDGKLVTGKQVIGTLEKEKKEMVVNYDKFISGVETGKIQVGEFLSKQPKGLGWRTVYKGGQLEYKYSRGEAIRLTEIAASQEWEREKQQNWWAAHVKRATGSFLMTFDPKTWVDIAYGKPVSVVAYEFEKPIQEAVWKGKPTEAWAMGVKPAYENVVLPGLAGAGIGTAFGYIADVGTHVPGAIGTGAKLFSKTAPYVFLGTVSVGTGYDIGSTAAYEQYGMVEPGTTLSKVGGYGLKFTSAGFGAKAGMEYYQGSHPTWDRINFKISQLTGEGMYYESELVDVTTPVEGPYMFPEQQWEIQFARPWETIQIMPHGEKTATMVFATESGGLGFYSKNLSGTSATVGEIKPISSTEVSISGITAKKSWGGTYKEQPFHGLSRFEEIQLKGTGSDWVATKSVTSYNISKPTTQALTVYEPVTNYSFGGRLFRETYATESISISRNIGGTSRFPGKYGLSTVEKPDMTFGLSMSKQLGTPWSGSTDVSFSALNLYTPKVDFSSTGGLGTETIVKPDFSLPGGLGTSLEKVEFPNWSAGISYPKTNLLSGGMGGYAEAYGYYNLGQLEWLEEGTEYSHPMWIEKISKPESQVSGFGVTRITGLEKTSLQKQLQETKLELKPETKLSYERTTTKVSNIRQVPATRIDLGMKIGMGLQQAQLQRTKQIQMQQLQTSPVSLQMTGVQPVGPTTINIVSQPTPKPFGKGKGGENKESLIGKQKYDFGMKKTKEKGTLILMADPFSVQHSQVKFGKATHPKVTRKLWRMARRKGYKIPTVELIKEAKKKKKEKRIKWKW